MFTRSSVQNLKIGMLVLVATFINYPIASAHDVPDTYSEAMAKASNSDKYNFAYTVKVKTSDGPVIGSFDPRRSDHGWKLSNPSDPAALTKAQAHAWHKMTKRSNPATAIQVKNVSGPLTYISTVKSSDTDATYSVKPLGMSSFSKSHEKVVSKLSSDVTIQLNPPRLLSMNSRTNDHFNVAPFAKIDSISEIVKMQYLPKSDVTVVESLDLTVTGNNLVMSHSPNESFEISNVVAIPKN